MARFLYSRFKAELLRQTLDVNIVGSNDLIANAFDAGAGGTTDAHEFLADLPAGSLEGSPVIMTSVTVSDDGELDFADYTFTAISGDTVEAILYTLTHTVLADELLVYYDDDADFTPDGNDVNVSYASYVFKL